MHIHVHEKKTMLDKKKYLNQTNSKVGLGNYSLFYLLRLMGIV